MTLSNNQRRKMKSASRLYAVQALFQMEAIGANVDQIIREFSDHRFGEVIEGSEMSDGDFDLFKTTLLCAVEHQSRIDQLTDRALVAKWPLGRVDSTLRAAFRAAGAELIDKVTPPKVVIAEFVSLIQAFYPEGKERQFVNAVLDHVAREVQPENFEPR